MNKIKLGLRDLKTVLGGAGFLLIADVGTKRPTKLDDIYDVQSETLQEGWKYIGATKDGVSFSRSNESTEWEVDQVKTPIFQSISKWDESITTQLAEYNDVNLKLALGLGSINYDATLDTHESQIKRGTPSDVQVRMFCVLVQQQEYMYKDYIFAHVFYRGQYNGDDVEIALNKGDMAPIPLGLKVLADPDLPEEECMGITFRQIPGTAPAGTDPVQSLTTITLTPATPAVDGETIIVDSAGDAITITFTAAGTENLDLSAGPIVIDPVEVPTSKGQAAKIAQISGTDNWRFFDRDVLNEFAVEHLGTPIVGNPAIAGTYTTTTIVNVVVGVA